MKEKLFTGTATAIVTPFYEHSVNYALFDILLRRQLAAGIKTIVVGGTTGEGATLTDQEKTDMIAHSKMATENNAMIIAGTGSNNTQHAIDLSIAAQTAGADALLIVTPYYNKATKNGLIAHYRAIAEAVSIPIILYNVPSRTGVDIPIGVYKELCQIRNICGVKEASPDIIKTQRIRLACNENFGIWCGNDDMVCASMAIGADGVISVASNILPKGMKQLTDSVQCGDFHTAAKLQLRFQNLIDCLFCEVNPIPVKAALKCIGFDCGQYRLPLTQPTSEHIQMIKQCLKEMQSYDSSVF